MATLEDKLIEKKGKQMASVANESIKKEINVKGAWTDEEDRKLAEAIEICGAIRWKLIAAKAGLNRCGKSCRLRWLNYLRPNIKRGNISDQEEDLILRLHKLLGNRWSLIAGRLPGRTDNEIKNYWNSYLSKKIIEEKQISGGSTRNGSSRAHKRGVIMEGKANENKNTSSNGGEDLNLSFEMDDFFDFSNDQSTLEWVSRFLE